MMKNRIITLMALTAMAVGAAGCSKTPPGQENPGLVIAVESVAIAENAGHVLVGGTLQLSATISPSDASNQKVVWQSSDPTKASVDGNGVVSGHLEGEVTITVRTAQGNKTDQCTITVGTLDVKGVSFAQPKFNVSTTVGLRIEPVFDPANATNKDVTWDVENPAIATVEWNEQNKGWYVRGLADGTTKVTVITDDGGHEADCEIEVDWLGPAAFVTNKTWTVGNQTWSDVVIAAGCSKTSFDGGYFNEYDETDYALYSDCRSNLYTDYGDLFSWNAVRDFEDRLCPDGWRVPTRDDYVDLDLEMGGTGTIRFDALETINTKYLNESVWGGHFGGVAIRDGGGQISNQDMCAEYWAITESFQYNISLNAYRCVFCMAGEFDPKSYVGKTFGHVVRCVK